ncbi:MAG: gas vesicle protein K [Isosphaerales bacterium]
MIDTLTANTAESPGPSEFARILAPASAVPSGGTAPSSLRIALQPDDVKKGLGRLILTVVELLRELLERQAVRRIEAGSLMELEIERLGTTFLQLSEQMEVVKSALGLEGEDLNLDLGPLGMLLDECRGS